MPTAPMPTQLRFPGRILFLAADPAGIDAQLAGGDLTVAEAVAAGLRDDISTDEITPLAALVHFDQRLGRHVHTGFKAGDRLPIAPDAVRQGGFAVTVAGKRYGKGSSREHSPVAERAAGIRLVIATSFERIYRQNADNIGLFTSTDFGLIDRIRRGEPIDIEELVADRDGIAAAVLRAGGLLRYGRQQLQAAAPAPAAVELDTRPLTLFEKIMARHVLPVPGTTEGPGPAGLPAGIRDRCLPAGIRDRCLPAGIRDRCLPAPGAGRFVRADLRFIHDIYTAMASYLLHDVFGRPVPLRDPASILVFEDHFSYVHRSPAHVAGGLIPAVRELSRAHRAFVADYGLRAHGYLPASDLSGGGLLRDGGSEGISHAMMAESYALPGQLIVGTDSHTPHSGALGCVAFGIGTTDIANAMVTGAVRFVMPEILRIELNGPMPPGLTAKDIILHLLALPALKAGAGVGKVFEFAGSGIAGLSTDARATLTNMTAELGGFTGLVAPDAETLRFLKERRGLDFVIEPWMHSDAGARYAAVIPIDLAALSPMVAAPGDPGNGIALAGLAAPVPIDIAYGGSCTAGKREDFDQYHAVLAWAAGRGLRVPPGVTLFLQFGTIAVRDYCIEQGYLDVFEKVGAEILQPACGACANCGPGTSTRASQVTVSAINRNFPGRSGPGQVWLASPPTVAASAIAGELIAFEALRERFGRNGRFAV